MKQRWRVSNLLQTAVLAALVLSYPAFAHDFTFTWNDPTARTDGSSLNPNTEIKSYRLRCQGPQNVTRFVDRGVTTALGGIQRRYQWRDAAQADGLYSCQMTAIDTRDLESAWSHTAEVLKADAPPAPTGLGIGARPDVWRSSR